MISEALGRTACNTPYARLRSIQPSIPIIDKGVMKRYDCVTCIDIEALIVLLNYS